MDFHLDARNQETLPLIPNSNDDAIQYGRDWTVATPVAKVVRAMRRETIGSINQ